MTLHSLQENRINALIFRGIVDSATKSVVSHLMEDTQCECFPVVSDILSFINEEISKTFGTLDYPISGNDALISNIRTANVLIDLINEGLGDYFLCSSPHQRRSGWKRSQTGRLWKEWAAEQWATLSVAKGFWKSCYKRQIEEFILHYQDYEIYVDYGPSQIRGKRIFYLEVVGKGQFTIESERTQQWHDIIDGATWDIPDHIFPALKIPTSS